MAQDLRLRPEQRHTAPSPTLRAAEGGAAASPTGADRFPRARHTLAASPGLPGAPSGGRGSWRSEARPTIHTQRDEGTADGGEGGRQAGTAAGATRPPGLRPLPQLVAVL